MMTQKKVIIRTPVYREEIKSLRAGDIVSLTGEVLVFRDSVHRILCEMIAEGKELPFDLKDRALYYCGPTPPKHGMPVGAAGPTTSARMDAFTGPLLDKGLAVTIGKGNRSDEIACQLKKNNAVYLLAVGGAGAYIAMKIVSSKILAFPELGPEAARVFVFDELPLIVGIDTEGRSSFV